MSYRDDLAAAQARAEAAERRSAALEKRVAELEARQQPPKPDRAAIERVPIPERFDVILEEDRLRVRWRWFRAREHVFLFFFCLVWDLVVGAVVFGMFSSGKLSWSYLLISGHLAVGIGLTYSLIAGIFNRTTVTAEAGRLSVAHGPIPWRGNRTLVRAHIRQLYVQGDPSEENARFDLCVVTKDGREVKLVKNLEERTQARYLERAFELHLNIKDRAVPGELPKP